MNKAWVFEWADYADSPSINEENKCVLFLRGDRSADYIADLLEKLYVSLSQTGLTIGEKYDFAISNNKQKEESDLLPKYHFINGVKYSGRLWVGQSPYLVAKLVHNLVVTGSYPDEKVTWDEIPYPKPL